MARLKGFTDITLKDNASAATIIKQVNRIMNEIGTSTSKGSEFCELNLRGDNAVDLEVSRLKAEMIMKEEEWKAKEEGYKSSLCMLHQKIDFIAKRNEIDRQKVLQYWDLLRHKLSRQSALVKFISHVDEFAIVNKGIANRSRLRRNHTTGELIALTYWSRGSRLICAQI